MDEILLVEITEDDFVVTEDPPRSVCAAWDAAVAGEGDVPDALTRAYGAQLLRDLTEGGPAEAAAALARRLEPGSVEQAAAARIAKFLVQKH